MAHIRRCWAPAPLRPVVDNGYERELTYVYGGVSPLQGELDWSLSDKMNTVQSRCRRSWRKSVKRIRRSSS